MSTKFVQYNRLATYSGVDHAPAQGQPGHGNKVKHVADGEEGTVFNSNTERSLVQFGRNKDWYPNSDLLIREDFVVAN